MNSFQAKGFTLTELLIVVAIIGIIAAIAIPKLLSGHRQLNEQSAIFTLRRLHSSQMRFQEERGKGNFTNSFDQLAPFVPDQVCTLGAPHPRIPTEIAPCGYLFQVIQKKDKTTQSPARYGAIARPYRDIGFRRTGNDMFYVDETGVIRHSGSPTVWPDKNSAPIE